MSFLAAKDNPACELAKNLRHVLIRFNNKTFLEYIVCPLKEKAKPI